ncbi:MAG: inorganic phosphate transporter [Bdellovibrionota bacterium]|jgi:phosphate/sulfate permease
MDWYLVAVILLLAFAVLDLIVGVANDAVNFLNSALGSKVAPYVVIMTVASLGIICGVLFSSGMMEVARKGIFNPWQFTMPELMTVFFAVVCSDIILLDIFNSHGLPTSTTVAIVFNLLGASVAAASIKIFAKGATLAELGEYINSEKALVIISGIVLSIAVAFFFGVIVQLLSRLLFTFNVEAKVKRYGALWGGLALASITRFILIDGAKGTSFMTPENLQWLENNSLLVLGLVFVVSAIILEVLICLKVNIFKPIILIGTFALALSFAANDLVNFIGVPLAGLSAYLIAHSTPNPLTVMMDDLAKPVQTQTYFLLTAGIIMVATLWLSKRSKTVSQTEINLCRQDEGIERYESNAVARAIVRATTQFLEVGKVLLPKPLLKAAQRRLDTTCVLEREGVASFDLLRASVNLMVASAIVSFATSLKLPLSTTFVTFMVAMGSSFADQAWGRESAVYRVAGVLTVVSGWFATALFALVVSFIFTIIIHYLGVAGAFGIVCLLVCSLYRTHKAHGKKEKEKEAEEVFNLKKLKDPQEAVSITFQHTAIFIAEIRSGLNETLEALFAENLSELNAQKAKVKKLRNWSNIITANIFKSLRILESADNVEWHKYTQSIRCLQSIAEGYGDVVARSYTHIRDQHKGLLAIQIEEARGLITLFNEILQNVETMLSQDQAIRYDDVLKQHEALRNAIDKINAIQIERIKDRSSKTRLSILFYAVIGNMRRISRQNLRLLEIFQESLLGEVVKEKDGGAEPLESV